MAITIGVPLPEFQERDVAIMSNNSVLAVGIPSVINSDVSCLFPPANSVGTNAYIEVHLPITSRGLNRVINCQGADTVTDDVGSDTLVELDNELSGIIRFISDGVSDWRL